MTSSILPFFSSPLPNQTKGFAVFVCKTFRLPIFPLLLPDGHRDRPTIGLMNNQINTNNEMIRKKRTDQFIDLVLNLLLKSSTCIVHN